MKNWTQRYFFDFAEPSIYTPGPGYRMIQDQYPIDFTGALLCVENDSTVPVSVTIVESDDGVTWTVVLFSTATTAGNLDYTIVPRSRAALLFTSASKYVAFLAVDATDPNATAGVGVKAWVMGYPPDPGRAVSY